MNENRLNLSKRVVETIPFSEKGKTVTYHDATVIGLILLVSGGAKTFYVYKKINGSPHRIKIGRYPDISIEQARKEASKVIGEIALGNNPVEEKRTRKAESTLQDVFDDFFINKSRPLHRSWKEEKRKYDVYLSVWKGRRLSTIRNSDILALFRKIGTDNGQIQANRVLTLLKTLFNHARAEMGFKGENPCVNIKKFAEERRERFIQESELPKFFDAVQSEPDTTFKDLVLIALFTGQRRDNVLSMRWDEINFDREEWIIPADKFKGKREHAVPLVDTAMKILLERKGISISEWVFQSDRTKTHWVEPKTAWERFLKRAGIVELRIHDLRRTLASYMAITGTPELIISGMLGHSVASVTGIYARLNLRPINDGMERAIEYIISKSKAKDTGNEIEFRQAG